MKLPGLETMSRAAVAQMIDEVADGVRVLSVRDGLPLSDEQVRERATNIVTGILATYAVEPLR